jgi:hypothetical protein
VRQRLPDATVQFVTGELRPPLVGNIGSFEEPLRIAGRYACRSRRLRQRVLAIRIDLGGRRGAEVRTDRAKSPKSARVRAQQLGLQPWVILNCTW